MDLGGYKPSGLGNFLKNDKVRELIEEYEDGRIKSVKDLKRELEENGIVLSLSTLNNYLGELKKVFV